MRWHVHFNEQDGDFFWRQGKPCSGEWPSFNYQQHLEFGYVETDGERFFVFGTGRIHTRCGTAREEDEEFLFYVHYFGTLFLELHIGYEH